MSGDKASRCRSSRISTGCTDGATGRGALPSINIDIFIYVHKYAEISSRMGLCSGWQPQVRSNDLNLYERVTDANGPSAESLFANISEHADGQPPRTVAGGRGKGWHQRRSSTHCRWLRPKTRLLRLEVDDSATSVVRWAAMARCDISAIKQMPYSDAQ